MEQRDIQELITHPERLDASTLLHLRELVARYPYFQTAWVLYLKNLFILGDPNFKEELRRGALFVADLSVLFYYIEGERFSIKKHNVETEVGVASGSDRTLDLIDRFLAEMPEAGNQQKTVAEVPIPVEMPGDYTSVLLAEVTEEEQQAAPLHGQELIDQFIEQSEETVLHTEEENHSDADVDADSEKKLESNVENEAEAGTEAEAETESESECEETEESETEAEPQEEELEESYFTETLAKIYVRQQRYDKALEIIKKLNLKYPKKNAYFADQIRFLEKLIINAKSK